MHSWKRDSKMSSGKVRNCAQVRIFHHLKNHNHAANGEISLLTNKISGTRLLHVIDTHCPDQLTDVERDLESERRKAISSQESLKESEKEYHKLKVIAADITVDIHSSCY